jgi:hypothetical protein
MTVPGILPIGLTGIGGSPSPYALGAAEEAVFSRADVIYACEIEAGVRGWEPSSYMDGIGNGGIGYVPLIVRTLLSDPIYVATAPYTTDADQVPISQPFPGCFAGFSHRRSIATGDSFGVVALGDGDITIDNTDGIFDGRILQVINGRDVIVRAGAADIPYEWWPIVFKGTAREWSFDQSSIRIAIRDLAYRLQVPLQTTLFAGTGFLEGDDNLKGKRKPRLLGRAINFTPSFVDQPNLIYLANDGPVDAIFAVRDRGIPLSFDADYANYAALVAASISDGEYATCLAEGLIRLGADADGTVTADGATYRSTGKAPIATVIRRIIEDHTDITEFYDGAFNVLAALYPNDAGLYLDENDNSQVIEVLDRLLKGIAGWVAMTRGGLCTVGVLSIPDNPARAYAGMGNIIDDPSAERLPANLSPPPWRLRLNYATNQTKQPDISTIADPYYAKPALVATASDSDVLVDNAAAQDLPPVEGYLVEKADAEAEVARQFLIFKEERPLRRARFDRRLIPAGIGDVIDFDPDRLGGRRLGMIVEDNIGFGSGLDTIEMVLYG